MKQRDTLSKADQEGARQWLLHRLRVAAYDSKPEARAADAITSVYEVVDPIVAKSKAGAPPLTKSTRDAYVALQSFMLSQMPDGVTLTEQEKQAVAGWLVSAFPTWSADEQRKLAQAGLTWEVLQQEWTNMPAGKKAEAKASWKKALGPLATSVLQQRAEEKKKVAEEKAKKSKPLSGSAAYAKAMEKAQSSYRSYQFLSSAMTQSHYARMNSMAAWGGSSYRYVNQYGTPY
jgi:hypothetical protein